MQSPAQQLQIDRYAKNSRPAIMGPSLPLTLSQTFVCRRQKHVPWAVVITRRAACSTRTLGRAARKTNPNRRGGHLRALPNVSAAPKVWVKNDGVIAIG